MKLGKLKLKKREKSEKSGNNFWLNIVKGTLIALSFSLVGILIFAFILKFTNISESVITPINQVIKGVSIFLGVFIALKKQKEIGLVSGLLIGLIYTIFAFLVFSILAGHFVFDISLLIDMAFGSIIGGICGIISVNIKKSSV